MSEVESINEVFKKMKRPGQMSSEYSEWIYLNICCTEEGIERIARQAATLMNLPGSTPRSSWEFSQRRMEETFCNRGLKVPDKIQTALNKVEPWRE